MRNCDKSIRKLLLQKWPKFANKNKELPKKTWGSAFGAFGSWWRWRCSSREYSISHMYFLALKQTTLMAKSSRSSINNVPCLPEAIVRSPVSLANLVMNESGIYSMYMVTHTAFQKFTAAQCLCWWTHCDGIWLLPATCRICKRF